MNNVKRVVRRRRPARQLPPRYCAICHANVVLHELDLLELWKIVSHIRHIDSGVASRGLRGCGESGGSWACGCRRRHRYKAVDWTNA